MNLKAFLCIFFALAISGCDEVSAGAKPALASAEDPLGTTIIERGGVSGQPLSDPRLELQRQRLEYQERQLAHQKAMQDLAVARAEEAAAANLAWNEFIKRDVLGIVALFLYGFAGMGIMWIQSAWFSYREAKGVKISCQDKSARRLALAIIVAAGVIAAVT